VERVALNSGNTVVTVPSSCFYGTRCRRGGFESGDWEGMEAAEPNMGGAGAERSQGERIEDMCSGLRNDIEQSLEKLPLLNVWCVALSLSGVMTARDVDVVVENSRLKQLDYSFYSGCQQREQQLSGYCCHVSFSEPMVRL